MSFNVLNKINEVESITKEIRDNLNKTKTSEKINKSRLYH
jgi:hypothetical protein